MKNIYLLFIFVFIFVGIPGGRLLNSMHKDYLEQLSATPEQLKEMAQETPCAADAFRQALQSDIHGYQTEVLSVRSARELAEECSDKSEQADIRQKKESEKKELREKQLKALNEFPPDKEGQR